jgi:nucleotide-binding universal stress UspA family protein
MTALPRRILVPVDSGPRSDDAVAHAVALAAALDGELLLLGVVPLPALGPLTLPPEPDGMVGHADPTDRVILRRLKRKQEREASGVRSRACLRWGPAGPAIVDAASQEDVDLVVVPRHPGGGVEHMLHESPHWHVVRHSSVPVLAV